MAKSKKQKRLKRQTVVLDVQKESFLEKLEHLKFIFVFFVLLYFLLVILYKPMVIQGFEPSGSDIISGIGKTHQLKMWEGKTGHYPKSRGPERSRDHGRPGKGSGYPARKRSRREVFQGQRQGTKTP